MRTYTSKPIGLERNENYDLVVLLILIPRLLKKNPTFDESMKFRRNTID